MQKWRCPSCLEVTDDFAVHKSGRHSYCRSCARAKRRQYYENNKHRWAGTNLKKRFGLSQEDYAKLLAQQGGGCAVCGTTTPGGRGIFHVDHDHACCPHYEKTCGGCIRGLLCVRCNTMLGMSGDSAERLRAAANYLEYGD